MKKRGLSDIITTVLIILIALGAIVLIGTFIFNYLGDTSDYAEARLRLFNENYDLVNVLPIGSDGYDVILKKTSSEQVTINRNNSDSITGLNIVSVIDVSGSMVLPEPATYKELTISGWANLTSRDTQGSEFISFGNAAIIRLDEISRGTEGICAEIHPSGSIFLRETYPPTSINYANTGWHHFAYTYDEKNHVQRLYVDGNLKNTTYYGGNISFEEVGSIFIGKHAYA